MMLLGNDNDGAEAGNHTTGAGRAAGGRGFCAWARFEWSGLLVSQPPARAARSSVDGWMEVIMRLSTAHNQRTDGRTEADEL